MRSPGIRTITARPRRSPPRIGISAEAAAGDAARANEHRAKAKAALDAYIKGTPDATIEEVKLYWPFRDKADEERLVAPLRALGVPEAPSG